MRPHDSAWVLLLALPLLSCRPAPTTFDLDVQVFDCAAGCWADASISVPGDYWKEWQDGSACDDAGFYMTYDDSCVATNRICDSDWSSDPAVGDASSCCGGVGDDELQTAPQCGDTAASGG